MSIRIFLQFYFDSSELSKWQKNHVGKNCRRDKMILLFMSTFAKCRRELERLKIRVFDEAFFLLTMRMPMITKLFKVVAWSFHQYICMTSRGVVLWGHVTNKIHISTCIICIDTTLGKVLTCVRGSQT